MGSNVFFCPQILLSSPQIVHSYFDTPKFLIIFKKHFWKLLNNKQIFFKIFLWMKGALTVQITKFFHKLPKESKNSIYLYNFKRVLNKDVKIIQNSRRRSIVFEDKEQEIILKKLLPDGKGDNDICALLELHDSPYFPKMFAYKKRDYLFIEKAKGKTLLEMLKEGISLEELRKILNQLIKAKKEMMSVNRYDFDFKLEHIYWDKEQV